MLVLAFVLWYELESHALGPEGPQVVVTVTRGVDRARSSTRSTPDHVIGSSLAFRSSTLCTARRPCSPGSYPLHQNQTFAQVRAILAAGPNIYPVDVGPGFTLHEVAAQVDSIRATRRRVREGRSSGAVHSAFSPPGSNDLEGMLGTGTYLVLPGRERHHHRRRHGAALRPQATQAAG